MLFDQELRLKTNKYDFLKLRSLHTAKETINQVKKTTKWERIIVSYISDKRLISRVWLLKNQKRFKNTTMVFKTKNLKIGKKIAEKFLKNVHYP